MDAGENQGRAKAILVRRIRFSQIAYLLVAIDEDVDANVDGIVSAPITVRNRDAGCEMRDARCEMRDERWYMRIERWEMRDER